MSLTFVPAMTSMLVRPRAGAHETWVLRKAHALYAPALRLATSARWGTLGASVLLLGTAVALFSQLGGEFIPQLDEGDILIEARRLPGVALTETVATDLRLERALLHIPEVTHVVSRAGAPEVATDPMGLDQSDVYVELKDRQTWRSGLTKAALAKAISDAIDADTPEIAGAISQPIQMRTNELVAGVRSDVAVLVYGADLAILARLGDEIARAVGRVAGAEDVRAEPIGGLRYLRISPDRAQLARYGLTIADVNEITETMSVGHATGTVLEGEKRFDIVIKVAHDFAGDLEPLRALPLRSSTGQIVRWGTSRL